MDMGIFPKLSIMIIIYHSFDAGVNVFLSFSDGFPNVEGVASSQNK